MRPPTGRPSPSRAATRRVAAAGALAVGLALALLAGPGVGPVEAHDVLAGTTPSAGATVGVLPDEVVLHFEEPAQALGTVVVVRGPSGNVADGPAELLDTDVRQPVRTGSPDGHYTVDWRVVSADGHVVQGTFAFTARSASTGTAPPLPAAVHADLPTAAGSSTTGEVRAAVGLGGLLVLIALVMLVVRPRRSTGPHPTNDELDIENDDDRAVDDQAAPGAAPAELVPGVPPHPTVGSGAVAEPVGDPVADVDSDATAGTGPERSPLTTSTGEVR